MSRSGLIGIGLAVCVFAAVGVVSASCIDTSGLAGGAPLASDADVVVDTGPTNPDPCGKDLQNDLANCGSCGNVCGFGANSFPLCTAGVCTIGCNTAFGNCDNNIKNGCETALAADPLNCNACGHNCGGGSCAGGQCGAVALTAPNDAGIDNGYPISLAIDGTSVYFGWYSNTNGTYDIVKQDKTSGVAVILATGTNYYSSYLTVDADPNGFVYFVRPLTTYFGQVSPSTPPSSADGAILKVLKTAADGQPQTPTIVAGSAATGDPGGLFVDSSNTHIVVTSTAIYFNTYGVNYYALVDGGVYKCPLTGTCNPEQLAPNEYGIDGLALDDTSFAFNNAQTALVLTCPIVGCPATPTQLAASTSARLMAQDAANFYWINQSNDSIVKVDRTTNTATTLAAGQPDPYTLAIDDKNVYWTDANNPGTLSSCAIAGCGGIPTSLVQNLTAARSLVTDTTAIYWVTQSTGGGVFKVVK